MALSPKKRVYGWLADFGGCGFYRLLQPLKELTEAKPEEYEAGCGIILPGDFADYDVIIGQRVCEWNEQHNPVERYIKLASDFDQLLVYEIDDDLFNVRDSNPSIVLFGQEAVKNNMTSCMNVADLVTVSTEPLADIVRHHNPNVRVIPNFIDEDVLKIERRPNVRTIIGWAGTSTHDEDFAVMDDALDHVLMRNPDSVFMTIGSSRYGANLPRNRVVRKRWIPATRKMYRHTAQFDIGIAPLADNIFNESKSYIKVLEYAALGIPCVASNFGPYRQFIDHGETGFLADTPKDWIGYLTLLINDEELRLKMGARARWKAAQFTIQDHIWRYVDAYEG